MGLKRQRVVLTPVLMLFARLPWRQGPSGGSRGYRCASASGDLLAAPPWHSLLLVATAVCDGASAGAPLAALLAAPLAAVPAPPSTPRGAARHSPHGGLHATHPTGGCMPLTPRGAACHSPHGFPCRVRRFRRVANLTASWNIRSERGQGLGDTFELVVVAGLCAGASCDGERTWPPFSHAQMRLGWRGGGVYEGYVVWLEPRLAGLWFGRVRAMRRPASATAAGALTGGRWGGCC